MSYRVEFLSSARKEFDKLPRVEQARVGRKIDQLAHDPRPPGSIKLAGESALYRIRVGVYRVLYTIEPTPRIVAIARIAHRRESYRGL